MKEEVGIELDPKSGGLVLTRVRNMADDVRVNDINDIYLYEYDGDIDLTLATTDEVKQAKWMDRSEIVSLFLNGEVVTGIKDLSYFLNDPAEVFC